MDYDLKTFLRENAEPYTLDGEEVEAVAEHDIIAATELSAVEIASELYDDPDIQIWVDDHPDRGRSRFYAPNRI